MASPISRVDVVGIPSSDAERSRGFYVDTLGLRPDENARYEFRVESTFFAIWQPAQFGVEYQPQANSIVLLRVDDVPAARAELEAEGVEFSGDTFDTGVCHMAFFTDPDGNDLMLHSRHAPVK